jgi:Eukaryotic aspartyl protease
VIAIMKRDIALHALLSAATLNSLAFAAFPVRISKRTDVESQLGSRQEQEDALINQIQYYMADVEVGTPGQPITLQIDTGSSDIWVIDVNAAICQPQGACPDGTCKF